MGNAEGFVQVQVRHIASVISWTTQSYLRIHVSTIQINLSADSVDHVADPGNSLLENCK